MRPIAVIMVLMITLLATGGEDPVKATLDKKMAALTTKYFELRKKLLVQAIEEYEALKVAETKKGNLEGALKYRDSIKELTDQVAVLDNATKAAEPAKTTPLQPVQHKPVFLPKPAPNVDPTKATAWKTPAGGSLTTADGVITLSGEGTAAVMGSLAVLQQDLGRTYTITGEIMVSGRFGGFAFGCNEEEGRYYSFYRNDGQGVDCWRHTSLKERKRHTVIESLYFGYKTWKKFEIRKRGSHVEVKLDDKKGSIIMPASSKDGPRWGLASYFGTTVQIKNIKVTD